MIPFKRHPHFFYPPANAVAQRSKEWFAQREKRITSSRLGGLLFLNNEEEYNQYWEEVLGNAKPEFSEQTKAWMAYGVEHEERAISSFMDALTTQVDGHARLHAFGQPKNQKYNLFMTETDFHPHREAWAGASPDGLYVLLDENNNLVEKGVLENKCPAKDKRPYQKVKYYYVPQTYWHMTSCGWDHTIFTAWGPRNLRAWRYKFDPVYWQILCNLVRSFRRKCPWEELKQWIDITKKASEKVANDAEELHPNLGPRKNGWKQ